MIQIEVQGTDRMGRPGAIETINVLPEHEAEFRAYAALSVRYGVLFLSALFGLSVASLVVGALGLAGIWSAMATGWAVGACVSAMGVLILVLPLATPDTVRTFGARRAIQIARVCGGVTLAFGVAIVLMG